MQSSNEELESSKEELQSLNEELQTVNHELSDKVEELDRANSDLRNVFVSTQIATVFLDQNLVIRSFTPSASELFNIIPTDAGRPLTDLATKLDYPDLQADIRKVLEGDIILCIPTYKC
jgi:two-component system CheB/CheR fusion protein